MTFTSHVHVFLNLRASRIAGAALDLPHFSSFSRNIARRLRGSTTVVIDCGTETACTSGGRRLRGDSFYGPGTGRSGNHAPIKLHGYGALQQGNANDHPPSVLELNQDPFKSA
jgi:hypothetical protein